MLLLSKVIPISPGINCILLWSPIWLNPQLLPLSTCHSIEFVCTSLLNAYEVHRGWPTGGQYWHSECTLVNDVVRGYY